LYTRAALIHYSWLGTWYGPVQLLLETEACTVSSLESVARDHSGTLRSEPILSTVLGSAVPSGLIPPKALVVATDLIQSG
jgi:hypothetical protein